MTSQQNPEEKRRSLRSTLARVFSVAVIVAVLGVVADVTGILNFFGITLHINSTSHQWRQQINDPIPFCDQQGTSQWQVALPGTQHTCTDSGTILQHTSQSYGEIDLKNINGNAYDQRTFRVSVTLRFLAGDPQTYAGIIVQTPKDPSVIGGYIVAINSEGNWQVRVPQSTTPLASGQESVIAGQPIHLTVTVTQDTLSGALTSGSPFYTGKDDIQPDNTDTVSGLMIL